MNKRYTAIISTISNSFCDFTLDYAINKYNMYKVLAFTTLLATLGQLIIGLIIGIKLTLVSLPFILLYGVIILGGYILYVKSLKIMPIGLTGLIESGDLFIILLIDIMLGYITLTPKFIILFIIFIISIFIFSIETNRINIEKKESLVKRIINFITFKKKEKKIIKRVTIKGLILILSSMLLYCLEPYLIKIASNFGANEIAINLGYYIFGTTYFISKYLKSKNNNISITREFNRKFLLICIAIAIFETIYYFFATISYMNDIPIIVCIIQEIRIFLLVILSVIFKTDKMSLKKVVAILMAMISVSLLYFS